MKPNDKVVCVDDSDGPESHQFHWPNGRPVRDRVYVVESYYPPRSIVNGLLLVPATITVVGHPIIYIECQVVVAAMASRFRPVSEVGHPPVAVETLIETLT